MDTITTTQAAQRANVTPATIRAWARYGAVAAVKVSGRWNIDGDSLARRIALGAKPLTAENLVKAGGRRWQKNGHDRIYFNDWATLAGLDTTRYNTGNIWSARWRGQDISNSQAAKLIATLDRIWFDTGDGRFHCIYHTNGTRFATREEIFRAAIDGIKAAARAL